RRRRVALSVEKLRESEDGGNGKVQADASRDITKAIHASKRMEAFLQTARKQLDSEDKKSLFSANKEISDAIDLLLHKSHKTGVEMRFVSGDGAKEVMIWGNPVKFFQIAVNLISNAIDSYADKPPADGNAANAADIDAVTIRVSATAKRVRLTVEDKGCGIKEELRKSIFEPFFTTKQDRPRSECGFGLGLSTAKEIVERDFSGTIELETAEGKGSKFSVVIPLEAQ
ncbi:HAMP domain-containing histidine kinase, partial [Candidatus Parcubacteria bacterium]|nr:HAMP domain-containing histidine kinase [Candidatus Parcubacteria bacterium]